MNYGKESYWDYLEKSAYDSYHYYMAKGDVERANLMLTRSLSEALSATEYQLRTAYRIVSVSPTTEVS